MNNYYLALDVSSTTIGICGFAIKNNKINFKTFFVDYIKPSKAETEIENLHSLNVQINKFISDKKLNLKKYDNVYVAIEDFPLHMPMGKSTAQTIAKLAVYNRLSALFLYERLNIISIFYPVATIRATIKNLAGKKEKIVKEEIPELVCEIFKDLGSKWEFPYKKTRTGSIAAESYDMADSIAVAITCAYKNGDIKL